MKEGFKAKLKKVAKKIPFLKKFYHKFILKSNMPYDAYVAEVREYVSLKTDYNRNRINLLIPNVSVAGAFGGVATALNMFYKLSEKLGWDSRIIVTDMQIFEKKHVVPPKYKMVAPEEENDEKFQLVNYPNRAQGITVGKNDYFFATAWWTAYNIKDVIKWQAETYGTKLKPLIYLIQDYEPGFYAWSSQYVLAESTYRSEVPIYAAINSFELKDYLTAQGYSFDKTFPFAPALGDKLKAFLPADGEVVKKDKKIIIYGRPSTPRNAFTLAVPAIKKLYDLLPDAQEWQFISAGEGHPDIKIGEKAYIKSVGKMSLEEYAQTLITSYAGVSLMVSPHPSYPPLEMSTFGVKTITNGYANKDMSSFNENIISIRDVTPDKIAKALFQICSEYTGTGKICSNNGYVKNRSALDDVVNGLADAVKSFCKTAD